MNNEKIKPFFTDEYFGIIKLSFNDIFECLNQIYTSSMIKSYINVIFDLEKVFTNPDSAFDLNSIEYKLYHDMNLNDIMTRYNITDKKDYNFVLVMTFINKTLSYVDELILQRIILNKAFGDEVNDEEHKLPIFYDDDHKIVLTNRKRYISLICLFMFIYSTTSDSDILRLIQSIKSIQSSDDKISLFDSFHKFIHLNKKYSSEDVEFKFIVTQSYLLLKSLYIMTFSDVKINNTYIDRDLIYDDCEFDCMLVKSGSDTVWSNIILSSVYLYKSKYDSFNSTNYNKFTKSYSNVIVDLGSMFKARNNYKYLYSLGTLLSLKFLNINNTNENNGENVMLYSYVSDDIFGENNDAFCVAVKRNITSNTLVKRNIIVEKQIDSYLIYDTFCKNLFNIRDVYYSITDLNDNISGKNSEDLIGIINGGYYSKNNISLFISYFMIIIMFIVVITLLVKNYREYSVKEGHRYRHMKNKRRRNHYPEHEEQT